MRKWLSALLLGTLAFAQFSNANAATVKAGASCIKLKQTKIVGKVKFTCTKSGTKFIWNKGILITKPTPRPMPSNSTEKPISPIPTPTANPPLAVQVQLPLAGTNCEKVGEKVLGQSGYMRCSWMGHANTEAEARANLRWRYYPISKTSSSKSNSFSVTPSENSLCSNSGDTFDISTGILECRWTSSKKLQWIKINTVKSSFLNAPSPVSIDVCKLQNSDAKADQSGRNSGAGLAGFPFINSDKHGMNVNGTNEVLIVPIDFPDFMGGAKVIEQLDYDKKWLTDWYSYFSNGKSKFNVTTINHWLRMPQIRSFYPTDGKTTSALTNGNEVMGNQAQAFITEITKEVDLRKFSTIYIFFPEGEYKLNDLIVRGHTFSIKEGEKILNLFSWGRNLEGMETLKWSYYIHETLHDFNIIGHAPGNGWPLGIMTNQSGISYAMNPYEQFLLNWLPSEQIFCVEATNLNKTRISITPVEREDRQTKMAIVKLSPTKEIVIESHGIDKWSDLNFGDRTFPPGFYSVMAYVVDLDKAAAPPIKPDGSSIANDDWAWAVWQRVNGGPSNDFNLNVGDRRNLADYVAVLGDSFLIEGVRIDFVATGDYETIEISKV